MIMNMARYEQETIIGFNEEEKTAGIYTHNKVLRQKLEALAPIEENADAISAWGVAAGISAEKSVSLS